MPLFSKQRPESKHPLGADSGHGDVMPRRHLADDGDHSGVGEVHRRNRVAYSGERLSDSVADIVGVGDERLAILGAQLLQYLVVSGRAHSAIESRSGRR